MLVKINTRNLIANPSHHFQHPNSYGYKPISNSFFSSTNTYQFQQRNKSWLMNKSVQYLKAKEMHKLHWQLTCKRQHNTKNLNVLVVQTYPSYIIYLSLEWSKLTKQMVTSTYSAQSLLIIQLPLLIWTKWFHFL